MTRLLCVLVFALVPALAFSEDAAVWQQRAIAKYPDLAREGTPIHTRFLALMTEAKEKEPTLFKTESWPVLLADRAAKSLQGQTTIPANLAPTREATSSVQKADTVPVKPRTVNTILAAYPWGKGTETDIQRGVMVEKQDKWLAEPANSTFTDTFTVIDVSINEKNDKVFITLTAPAGKFDRPSGSFDLNSPPLTPQIRAEASVTDKTRPKWEAVTKGAKIKIRGRITRIDVPSWGGRPLSISATDGEIVAK